MYFILSEGPQDLMIFHSAITSDRPIALLFNFFLDHDFDFSLIILTQVFFPDVQKLMGALLYLHYDLDRSPYKELLSQDLWTDVKETLTKDACALLDLSVESPLTIW